MFNIDFLMDPTVKGVGVLPVDDPLHFVELDELPKAAAPMMPVKSLVDWELGASSGLWFELISYLSDMWGSWLSLVLVLFFTNPLEIVCTCGVSKWECNVLVTLIGYISVVIRRLHSAFLAV